jgi:hypothetical protein
LNNFPQLLERFGVTASNYQSDKHKASTKRAVVDLARHWMTYFSRIFPVTVCSSFIILNYLYLSLKKDFCVTFL